MTVQVMGVLNVTPDSFSDGGLYLDSRDAIARGHRMLAEGADIIDVGGESTRPGAAPVPVEVECDRVHTVVAALARDCVVSIDTRKPEIAHAAVAAGAAIINDVSASLAEIAAQHNVGWIAMHMQRTPETMQDRPHYHDVVTEVRDFLATAAGHAHQLGVHRTWVDPGIGFGKSVDHNLALLRHLEVFTSLGEGVVLGISRKSFIGRVLDIPDPLQRLSGALAVSALAVAKGAAILRTHDVAETVQAARMAERVLG